MSSLKIEFEKVIMGTKRILPSNSFKVMCGDKNLTEILPECDIELYDMEAKITFKGEIVFPDIPEIKNIKLNKGYTCCVVHDEDKFVTDFHILNSKQENILRDIPSEVCEFKINCRLDITKQLGTLGVKPSLHDIWITFVSTVTYPI